MKTGNCVANCATRSIYDDLPAGKSFVEISRETPRLDPRDVPSRSESPDDHAHPTIDRCDKN